MIEIKPVKTINACVSIPGSKSYTHRILIASALSDGLCTVSNILESEDTLLTLETLKNMGIKTQKNKDQILIYGTQGILQACDEIYLGNSGTSMRLLTALAGLGNGITTLTGTQRMQQRPIGDLLDGLKQMGIKADAVNNNACPPVKVHGGKIPGGNVELKCSISSQYLSALLLISPYTQNSVTIKITQGPVSKPYIDMTIDIMNQFNIKVERDGYDSFYVPGNQVYKSGNYIVEPDGSNAGYFWASAAVTKGTVKVKNISQNSIQGDVGLLECFKKMGCKVENKKDGIIVTGGQLSAIDVDMSNMPDMVPTLAVVAAFAKGTTKIRNVAHLKAKECDRLTAVATELSKMGAKVVCTDNELLITGSKLHGAEIDTYDDHRMAMCFAVAGLQVPGIFIKDEGCVKKSFPNFWDVFQQLY